MAAEKDSKGKDGKKKKAEGGVPELPNIGYAIGNFAPNSKIGKFFLDHSNWYVLRIAVSFIVVLLFMIFFSKVFKQRSVKPTRIQTLAEMIVEGLDNLCAGVLGKEVSRRYLPFLGSLFLFIVALNFFGMVPLGIAPTAGYQEIAGIRIPTATSALAICTLIVTQYTNFKYNSVKTVFLHWCGNPTDAVTWVIGIIFIPLHIFSDFIIKPLSLLLRLFGNIYGEDVLLGSMLMLGMMIFSFAHTNGVPLAFPLQLPFLFLSHRGEI